MQDPVYVKSAFARIARRYVLTNHVLVLTDQNVLAGDGDVAGVQQDQAEKALSVLADQ